MGVIVEAILVIFFVVIFVKYILWHLLKFLWIIFKSTLKIIWLLPILFFIPGFFDEGIWLIIWLLLIVSDYTKGGGYSSYSSSDYTSDYSGSYSGYGGYVINKKSKIAHPRYDDSVDTIAPRHRIYTDKTADELRADGYTIKGD